MTKATLRICADCSKTPDAMTVEALSLRLAPMDVAVTRTACLGPCDTPTTIALHGPGLASYVFAGLDLIADADDIEATCRTYLASPNGWIEDARPCGRLRECLTARVPMA